jgi:hypothetical protein
VRAKTINPSPTCACSCLFVPFVAGLASARVSCQRCLLVEARAVAVAVCRARVVAAAAIELDTALDVACIDRAIAAEAIAAIGSAWCARLVLACGAWAAKGLGACVDVCVAQEQDQNTGAGTSGDAGKP